MFLYRVLLKKVKRVYKWPRPPGLLKKECSTLVYLKKKQSREWTSLNLFTRNEDMYTYAGCETSSLTRY